ncbi:Orotidine 5'-phosphate decarboxylase (EC 4.1.1.23) [uncultured Gammaproteobacteria bacterium]|jgi:orotidine-5'-phosphate decarboxylase|nr:Orotidine 5'-phosphate decarboxylase (EC 4.1.1.23) [uncultured Gammaproteobacteria bacterium]CAC9566659.1 Orotidine 5'-phosphate decarboxylase (EC 4.1.1.23) [uncultured Gammaproteobacteria bacterium]CAC9569093.1 Orotidine 5'-phosphate decarboxylase (EC 4.1.1.23) [uncultured Gammaproteobacteria bacterium]CAC9602633.1 Orotidine 5'-phosphate decarboxylase (EC 4.1.1.23) [uncultured Gammaproteobacteria bacterium]CAC9961621.1 Orotidine 5'-phosphate decarboxylase (EC 4.1.1.23) [uncultured Gammaprot
MNNDKYLSTKNIPVKERLIFALDVADVDEAKKIVEDLGDAVSFYKLGLELLMSDGYFQLIEWLSNKGKKVFADIKFNDVPQTVSSAIKQLRKYQGVSFVTVHSQDEALKVANAEKGHIKIFAVTILTSLDQGDVDDFGFKGISIKDLVLSRARRALSIGCDGVISSGLEASELRDKLGQKFIIISPGIRPVENIEEDDQKRTVDVEEAFNNGADYIVMGRPLREDYKKHYNLNSPREAAEHIQSIIRKIFS